MPTPPPPEISSTVPIPLRSTISYFRDALYEMERGDSFVLTSGDRELVTRAAKVINCDIHIAKADGVWRVWLLRPSPNHARDETVFWRFLRIWAQDQDSAAPFWEGTSSAFFRSFNFESLHSRGLTSTEVVDFLAVAGEHRKFGRRVAALSRKAASPVEITKHDYHGNVYRINLDALRAPEGAAV